MYVPVYANKASAFPQRTPHSRKVRQGVPYKDSAGLGRAPARRLYGLQAFNHGANTGQALKAGDFVRQIDAKLPHTATANDRARPRDIKTFRRDVEEADQIYLCGWAPHPPSPGNVTAKNLAKTLEWLGQGAHDWRKKHNISTRWTDVPQRELTSIDPPRSRQHP